MHCQKLKKLNSNIFVIQNTYMTKGIKKQNFVNNGVGEFLNNEIIPVDGK